MDNQTEIGSFTQVKEVKKGVSFRPWRIDWQYQRPPSDRSKYRELTLKAGELEMDRFRPGIIIEVQGSHEHASYVLFVNPDKTVNLAIGSGESEIKPGTTYNAELGKLFSITSEIREGEKGKVKIGRGFVFPYFDYDKSGKLLPLNQRTINNSVWIDGFNEVKVLKPLAGGS